MSKDLAWSAGLSMGYTAPALLDALPGGCLVVDSADLIKLANATFCEWVGHDCANLLGTSFPHMLSMGGKLFYANLHSVQERLNFKSQEVNYDVRCADGSYLPLSVTSRQLDEDLRLFLLQRVEVRRLYELQLREAKRAAEEATRVKSTFLATMTHELRSPIHAIIGASDVIRESQSPELGARALEILSQSAHNLLGLVNDILDISKAQLAELTLTPVTVDLWQLCHGILESMRLTVRTGQRLDIRLDYDAKRLHSHYLLDEGKLRRVLVNLLSNAIKFTSVGSVTLSVTLDEQVESGIETHKIRFAVVDTGEGIDPSRLESVFEPFVQEEAATRQGLGTGLGLSISRHLTHVMGGSLKAHSTLGEGSTFSFVLKAAPSKALTEAPQDQGFSNEQLHGLSELQVLVVDDNETNRFLAQWRLRQLHIEPRLAGDAEEALQLAADHDFDVIFMDLRMPGVDGVQATQQLKASERHAATPIVVMSAGNLEDMGAAELGALFAGTIPKPFTGEELTALLLDLFGHTLHLAVEQRDELETAYPANGSSAEAVSREGCRPPIERNAEQVATIDLRRLTEDFDHDPTSVVCREFLKVMHDDLTGLAPAIVAAVRQQDLTTLQSLRHRLSTVLNYINPEPLRTYFNAASDCISKDPEVVDMWTERFDTALQATIRQLAKVM